jgi:hypothetical protein
MAEEEREQAALLASKAAPIQDVALKREISFGVEDEAEVKRRQKRNLDPMQIKRLE